MILKLTDYTISIEDANIKISKNNSNDHLDMILFTDYDYNILNIGFGLGYLDKTILKAEYCTDNNNNEYYNVTISITMKDYLYIEVESINMDNTEMESIINIKDTIHKIDQNNKN